VGDVRAGACACDKLILQAARLGGARSQYLPHFLAASTCCSEHHKPEPPRQRRHTVAIAYLSCTARMQVKTEFLQLWDGVLPLGNVVVVGATNRPNRLNDAVWRRFGRHFEVRLRAALMINLVWRSPSLALLVDAGVQ
jgi:ATPase family associated with various cellular activities (AAA)